MVKWKPPSLKKQLLEALDQRNNYHNKYMDLKADLATYKHLYGEKSKFLKTTLKRLEESDWEGIQEWKLEAEKREAVLLRQNKLLESAAYFAEMIIAEHNERNYGQMNEWIHKFNDLELDWPIRDSGVLKREKEIAQLKDDFDRFGGHTAKCNSRHYPLREFILEKCNCGFAKAKERWK